MNLTIYYWKGIRSSLSFRNFDLHTSGSAGTHRIIIIMRVYMIVVVVVNKHACICCLASLPSLCADSFDFQISPTSIPELRTTPVQISVQLLNDRNAIEMEEETLKLILTERNDAGRASDFVLSTVDITIRNINST